jgi:hypothetical protein
VPEFASELWHPNPQPSLPDRLMVGLLPLEQCILVRVQVRQQMTSCDNDIKVKTSLELSQAMIDLIKVTSDRFFQLRLARYNFFQTLNTILVGITTFIFTSDIEITRTQSVLLFISGSISLITTVYIIGYTREGIDNYFKEVEKRFLEQKDEYDITLRLASTGTRQEIVEYVNKANTKIRASKSHLGEALNFMTFLSIFLMIFVFIDYKIHLLECSGSLYIYFPIIILMSLFLSFNDFASFIEQKLLSTNED